MSAVQPKDVLVIGQQTYRSCEGSLESEDTNFAHTIKVLPVWSYIATNRNDSVIYY